jgi:CO/xanthine dehydrogenase Mo-binding subunit
MTQAREFRVVGARVPPVDWDQRTAGAADYSADVRPDGLLYARVLRSVHAHARLLSVDCTAALRLPGVHAAVTADDLPPGVKYLHMGGDLADRRPLAKDVVRYVGEEIAAVAAETP